MGTGARVSLYANGVRVADGAPTDDPAAPTALSGLSITWGRGTTVDQPEAATCTFTLSDAPGGAAFSPDWHVGTPVQVRSTVTTYPDPTLSTFTDPGFEAAGPNATGEQNAAMARSSARAHAGAYAATVRPLEAARGASAVLAPAPFAPNGTDPGAWDAIAATAAGQTWSWAVWVLAAPGVMVTAAPVAFSAPWAPAWAPIPGAAPATVAGDGTWRQIAGVVHSPPAGRWLGVQIATTAGPTWDQLDPGWTWDAVPAGLTWDDMAGVWVDDVAVLAPAAGADQTVLVFDGRVTDMSLTYDDGIPSPVLEVTAADFLADLTNRDIGDEPWLLEALSARVSRILTLAGLPITAQIDASVAGTAVTWRDVDSQPAAPLLAELAASVDGVLWPAVHLITGAYVWLEDPANRAPLAQLELAGGVVVIAPAVAGLPISGCDLLLEPATWAQAAGDVTTRVAVSWQFQTTDDDGNPATEERTETLIDAGREDPAGPYGTRRYGLGTQLTTAADALAVADRILTRTGAGWRASGLTVDDGLDSDTDPAAAAAAVVSLLDGTTRNGLPIRLEDLPEWVPGAPWAGVYLEGGAYTFEAGRWLLELAVSSSTGLGQSAQWDQLAPAWTWDQFDPGITWNSLMGVGP